MGHFVVDLVTERELLLTCYGTSPAKSVHTMMRTCLCRRAHGEGEVKAAVFAFLLLTLLPAILLFDAYGARDPKKRQLIKANDVMAAKQTATKPEGLTGEFEGDIRVNDNLPTIPDLEEAGKIEVFDKDKKRRTFKSLHAGSKEDKMKVLVVFIRHFFCGNCQEYVRMLSQSIPPSQLSTLQPPTEIIVVGCGQPDLIPMYEKTTNCAFPVYADPSKKLYDILGMIRTLNLGKKSPEYMQESMLRAVLRSIYQELRAGRNMLSGGDFWQVGGEFLFEEGQVSWCHRMRNTRDHAEIGETRKQLGLDGGFVKPERKRWSTGLTGGLGRRLSSKRQSWHGGRSTTLNGEERSPTRKLMDQLKEEGLEEHANETATGPDAAFETLTKSAANGSANGSANGPYDRAPQAELEGAAINGTADRETKR
ncbi:MAG: hypothetical protein Q9217_005344 [Psora testacea]